MKRYEKHNDLNVSIVNATFLCNNTPASVAYGEVVSQLIRYMLTLRELYSSKQVTYKYIVYAKKLQTSDYRGSQKVLLPQSQYC